ncbi:hypothetical protein [Synechococcus sp. CCY 9618]|uniref:hypothetical protein n=1 Tax=Synechococcus sp. CCY 9618 TaxID=2815602 RepID=UPI0020B19E47|nr:hypothetical protein [Synechococcus sp. CCY 9618]
MVRLPSLRAWGAVFGSLPVAALPVAALVLLPAPEARAQEAGYGQTLGTSPMERQLYDYGPGTSGSSGGSILDSTNPLDLLNKLKRNTALDDATPPSSAVDQALREFDAQVTTPAPAGSSGQLKGI